MDSSDTNISKVLTKILMQKNEIYYHVGIKRGGSVSDISKTKKRTAYAVIKTTCFYSSKLR